MAASKTTESEKSKSDAWWSLALNFFANITGWIVAPIIAGIYLGKWLDWRFSGGQKYFYICVTVAFLVTNVGLWVNVYKMAKLMEKSGKDKK